MPIPVAANHLVVTEANTTNPKMNAPVSPSTPPTRTDALLTKKMAAQRLSVSVRTLDRLIAQGLLEKVFVGPSPRLRQSDIDGIIANGL